MKHLKRHIYHSLLLILPASCLAFLFCGFVAFTGSLNWLVAAVSITLSVISFLCYRLRKTGWARFFLFIQVVLFVILLVLGYMQKFHIMHIFASIASLKDFILSTGTYGMFVYVLVQFLQVMFIPIPSMIITLTGVAIYGPLVGAALCTAGVISASYASFFMGRIFGRKVATWIAGEGVVNKYASILNKKGKFFLIIAFLLPLFPDDILCLIAGITTMKFRTFFVIAGITRPIGIIFMSFFGGGYIVPFTGWGLYVWPFLLIFIITAIVLVTKHQTKLEQFVLKLLNKKVG